MKKKLKELLEKYKRREIKNPNAVPPVLKDLTHTQAQIVLAAYHEGGLHWSSLDGTTRIWLERNGYLYEDIERYLNVTFGVREKITRFYKLCGHRD